MPQRCKPNFARTGSKHIPIERFKDTSANIVLWALYDAGIRFKRLGDIDEWSWDMANHILWSEQGSPHLMRVGGAEVTLHVQQGDYLPRTLTDQELNFFDLEAPSWIASSCRRTKDGVEQAAHASHDMLA